jgi:hypothetical protein
MKIFSKVLCLRSVQSLKTCPNYAFTSTRLNNDTTEFVPLKSLRILNLRLNPIFEKMKEENPKEKTAILRFHQSYNSICNIGGYIKQHYDSDIEYALNINHAGRKRIVEGSAGTCSADERSLRFPLSMWPTVLKRA